jgi:hypothetical protein
MKYLIQVTEVYRVDTEEQVKDMIEEAKADSSFLLLKYTSQYKERKSKGEVIDSWYKVSFVKGFTEEKDPEATATINYEV